MNDRIQELEKKAYTEVMHERGGIYLDFDKEKFALLVVQECADFLKDKLDDHFAAEQLEEYFGVE